MLPLNKRRRRDHLMLFGISLGLLLLVLFVLREYAWIRGHVGDILVIPLIVFFLMSLYPWRSTWVCALVFGFALLVETTQYFNLADRLGFAKQGLWHQLLGNTFSLYDVLMYAVGALLSYGLLRWVHLRHPSA